MTFQSHSLAGVAEIISAGSPQSILGALRDSVKLLQDRPRMSCLVVLVFGQNLCHYFEERQKSRDYIFSCHELNKNHEQIFPLSLREVLMLSLWSARIGRFVIISHFLLTLAKVRNASYLESCGKRKCRKLSHLKFILVLFAANLFADR